MELTAVGQMIPPLSLEILRREGVESEHSALVLPLGQVRKRKLNQPRGLEKRSHKVRGHQAGGLCGQRELRQAGKGEGLTGPKATIGGKIGTHPKMFRLASWRPS